MKENNTLLLVNLNYPGDERDHIIYGVPSDAINKTKRAVRSGHERWKNAGADERRTVEEFIEEALRDAGIHFETANFEVENVDCDA